MAANSPDPLSVDSIISLMSSSLPKDSEPQLRNPYEAVALFSNACMLAVGFRLIGLGEEDRIEARSEASDPDPLPSKWNETSSYAFRYAHSQSSMEFLVKINRLGSKAVIFGLGLGDDKTTSFDISVRDFLSESAFPYSQPSDTVSADGINKALQDAFISPSRMKDLASLFKISIIQKLMPGINKPGYQESTSSTRAESSSSRTQQQQPPERGSQEPRHDPLRDPQLPAPARPYPFDDPLAAQPPRRPYPAGDFPPPGFEDEYEIHQPARGGAPGLGGGRNPLSIGDNDLYPPGLGPHDPLRGSFGPGGIGGGGIGGGGMHPTFDDPLFGGRMGGGDGGRGPDPRAPPGARYDPVGPGDGEPFGSLGGGFPGGPRPGGGPRYGGAGGAPPNPFGGFGSGDFI
ncbi:MAG: hypothetical protein M1819_001448 [Sarea resinae]|nr:MAG: hypothetical protein M1819_001448 [Sarea resinae]